jgi:cation:H+ antiporter
MILKVLFIVTGLALLIKGADWLVKGASALARHFRVSDLAIGLTIVAFGTSFPELVVNSYSSYQGHSDLVFGNVIGSNIFNLFAILGIVGLIRPLIVQSSTVWKEIPISLLAVILVFLLANPLLSFSGSPLLSLTDGLVLLGFFSGFLYYIYKQLEADPADPEIKSRELSLLRMGTFLIIGLLGLIFGGRLVVTYAVEIATDLGLSEKMIGLTILAAGTSLPELVTSVVAAARKNNDIAVGNIIGSNIFNFLFILSISALIQPIPYNTEFNTDLYFLVGGTLFLFLAMFTWKKKHLDRAEALILLAVFVVYTYIMIQSEGG